MKLKQTLKYYPLSSPQREIWFDQMLHPGVPLYNVGGYVQINGAIDPALFESAVNLLVQRHDALRTVLVPGTEEIPMQAFLEDLPVTVPFHDFSGEDNPRCPALDWMQRQFVLPFEQFEKPLFHFALLKIDDNCFFWLMKYHHLIVDGWGISLITQSLAGIYTQLLEGRKIERAAPSYLAFVENDRAYIESGRYEMDRQYWLEKYQTLPEPLFSPRYSGWFGDRVPPGERRVLWLPRPLYNRLLAFAKNTRSTPFHVMLGALYVDFTRTTQREELAIGLPILNRSNAAFKETVGLFIGVCAAWFQFGRALSFRQLLKAIGRTLKTNYRHQRLPISELNRAVGTRKTGRAQLFDIQLNYAKHDHDTEFGVFKAKTIALSNDNEQTPLSISVWEFHEHEDVQVDFVYNLAYFNSAEIERIQSRFGLVLEYVIDHADESIGAIPLVTEAEQQQLAAWNRTETDGHNDKTIVDLFQAQVEKTPDHIAVVFEDQQLGYRELNRKANQLAHYLMTLGVGAETLVDIYVRRSLEMVIGLLGILTAGGAYLPLDPDYPFSRLQFMLDDSGVKVLVSQGHLLESMPVSTAQVVCLDSGCEEFTGFPGENPVRKSGPGNSAYVIYTSGSTGKPKGVMIGHSALINFLSSMQQRVELTSTDKLLALTTLSFDIAVLELYLPLITGSRTIIISREIANNGERLAQKLAEYQITLMQATPATWKLLLQSGWHQLTPLTILCGGEALPGQLGQKLLKNSRQLWNVYGPTETTVWSSIHDVNQYPGKPAWLGKPVANTQIYILDGNHTPAPPGIPGELCIAGAGLARGYLNRPELTAEKFIEIAVFGKHRRFYKTGDLARWLPAGNLEYSGRIDHQIKLRGFRIELSEIEVTLSWHEAVKEAVVVVYNQENNPRLVAYVTLAAAVEEVAGVLRSWLNTRLPEYMLPASFTVLDKLPLTPNGKIDRKALPAPDLAIQAEQQAPRTEIEHLLCDHWSQVLGIEVTSIHSHFFEAGGHSLLATRLVSRIRESFGIEMPLRVVFDRALLREQAEWLEKRQRGPELPPIRPLAEGEPLVLSFAQQRLWFLAQLDGQSATYNMAAALHLEGQLDETVLRRTLTVLIQRHDSLRLCFPMADGEVTVQLNDVYNPLGVTDLSGLAGTEQQRRVTEWIANHAQTPFDLSTGPLLSLRLLKLGKQEQVLLFNMHHIISDGWSMGVLIREWSRLYNAYAQNRIYRQPGHRVPQFPKLPIQYTDYAAWQRSWLQGEILERQLAYWLEKLTGIPELLELPTDYPRPAVMGYQGKRLQRTLSEECTRGLKQLSLRQGVTVFMTLLAAFKVLLSRYSGQTDLVVGSPIANRTHRHTEDLIGSFVNTLALRTHIDGEQTFSELLKEVRQTALEAYSHQDIPFEYLVEQVNPSRSLGHSPLFQAMFVLQNAPEETLELSGLKISFLEPEHTAAKFDLTLSVSEQGGVFVCEWEYRADLFRPQTVARMAGHFQVLLEGILDPVSGLTFNPEQPLSRLPLLTEAEQRQLLDWNQTDSETGYAENKTSARTPGRTIVDVFQAQVEKTPGNIAVVFEDQQLTYQELNRATNRLAHYLLSLKSETGNCFVGICVERSLEMVTGLLGILKAGAAYVPLDPDYPLSRLRFMLADSSVPVVLSQGHLLEKLPVSAAKVVCLDSGREQVAACSGENPVRQGGAENPAYVIYTSGSTGMPKGVVIEHAALSNFNRSAVGTYLISQKDRVLQFASINFDAAAEEIYPTLTQGGCLILRDRAMMSTHLTFLQTCRKMSVTILDLPTAFWQQLMAEPGSRYHWPDSVRLVIIGGEAASIQHVKHWRQTFGQKVQLVNTYGPTEATVVASSYRLRESVENFPIGKPTANTKIYILDTYHNPTPIGIPGELCIAGAGLARGYLNRPELTSEKFIEIEVLGKPRRLYKTGDLARWLPDGNLEYSGRLDHQVKLRGFRIELPGIEAALTRHEAVKDAVVVLNKEDNPRLAAYVTLVEQMEDVAGVLRNWLKTRLPEYMLPAGFIVLDRLPLTPNGKIDRKALPAPGMAAFTGTYEAPRTGTEQRLVDVWNQVLKQTNIGIFDNFFERGGDSILSIRIVARAHAVGLELSPRDLFQHQTIAELAQVVRPSPAVKMAEQGPITGDVPPTPIQHWFFARQSGEPWHFNQAVLLAVPADIDEAALKQALEMILQHHDALRLRYRQSGDRWLGWHDVISAEGLPYHIEDLGHLSKESQAQALQERADFWQAGLNLETGPLVRLVLFHLGNESESRLLWCIHHLAVDGVSWRILLEDLQTAYHQAAEGRAIRLPAKTSPFKVWAQCLYRWKESESFAAQADYWQKLPGATPLPIDNPTGRSRIADSQHYTIHLTAETTKRLLSEVPAAYRTRINDLLLTALMLTLREWTGETGHLIDLESHGRTDLFEEIDLSRTVGWFTALHTLSLRLPAETGLGTALKAIKEQLRKVPHDGVGYGILRYLCRESLPQGKILFNYLGQFDQGVRESEFPFAAEDSGRPYSLQGQRQHLIEINGKTVHGCLSLTWSYSGEQYRAQTIQKLADNYRQQLQQLIEHCAASYGCTPSDFPLATTLNQTQSDRLTQRYGNNIADIYPLSPMQQGMLFHSLYDPGSGIYFEQFHCSLSGQLNIEAFRQAWQHLIDRHTILRTAFWHETDTPLQLVCKTVRLSWQTLDWRELPEAERQQQLQSLLATERGRGFELHQAPLMRLQVIRETHLKWRLVWHSHHILMDGWCLPILFTELFEVYRALAAGQIPRLPPIRPYRDYIAWLSRQDREMAKAYWQEQLEGFSAPTPLPMEQYREGQAAYQELTLTLELQPGRQLQHFSRRHRLTLNTLVQGAWAALLSRYSGENDVLFGVTTSGRQVPITGIDRMLGLFINTLPLRVQLENNDLLSGLRTIQQRQQQNNQYAYTALADIQNWSEVPNGISLFDTIVVFENYPVDEKLKDEQHTGSLRLTDFKSIEYTNYPITLVVIPGEKLHFKLIYDGNRFQKENLERMLTHLSRLLAGMAAHPGQSWHRLPLLTEADQQQLLDWNQTETDYPEDQTIVDLFQAQVEKTPDNIAVVFEDRQQSYRELNRKANRLAHYLLGLKSETDNWLVGICVQRSLEMLTGLLGILKAGGAYVPLDPDYPLSRLQFMLEDSEVKVLLSQSHLLERLPLPNGKVVCLDSPLEKFTDYPGENPVRRSRPGSLAYVIYTSGSTGRPKGVAMPHGALYNLICWQVDYAELHSSARTLQFTSLNFDVSFQEIFSTWSTGGNMVLVSEEIRRDAAALFNYLYQHQIERLYLPFVALDHFAGAAKHSGSLFLKDIITAGEQLKVTSALSHFFANHFGCRLHNHYGPTESHVVTSYLLPKEAAVWTGLPPIGAPIANTRIYILDANHGPTPPGIPGELCIAGAALAGGYLNRPELTVEKFIEIEVFGKPQRLYKTGDFARWLPGGNLEYLGRLDHQVKLRGFRIELSEIEVTLSRHEAVKEAVVVLYKEDNPRLAAYVTLAVTIKDAAGFLRNWLKTRLPEYMLPASFTILDKLPLTPNGKIDRKALPAPDLSIRAEQQAPRTETELLLCESWSQVLGIEVTSIHSHFFEAGGHSLLATQLVSRIRERFGIEMPLRVVFDRALLREQAEWLEKQQRGPELPPIVPLAEGEPLVLSFAQQRLWFLAQLDGQNATYNMPAALHLQGQLDETVLIRTLTALIQRHDSLRLCFPMVDGEVTIQINDVYNPLGVTDLSGLPGTEQQCRATEWIANHAQTPFDLSTGPLLSLRLLKLDKQEQILLFNMHHIIGDGWSMGVLIREWSRLYNAYAQNRIYRQPGHRVPQLAKLPIQYTDYAAWQRSWLQGEILDRQLAYWIEKLTGIPELLEIPTDYPRPAVMGYQGKHLQRTLAEECTRGLKQLSRRHGVTVFMTLLAAFKVLLFRYSGQTDLVVGTPIANRTHRQTEDLIGSFVNTLALRTHIDGEQTFSELLKQVKQTALEAYSHQDIPFEYLVEQVNPSRSLGHSPLFQAMFVLQNAPEETLELSGLKMSFLEPEHTTAKFDLTLNVKEHGDGFVCDWEYRTDLFRPGTVARMTEHFRVLLGGILDPVSGLTNDREQPLSQLPLLTEAEQRQLLDWNQTDSETGYAKNKTSARTPGRTIVDVFQAQVEKTPGNIAVVFEDQQQSYRELNRKANQLAHYLLSLESETNNRSLITGNCLVGICVERSLEMVTGLLGILKAGAAYVPLDPDYPLSRLRFMLADSSVPVMLSRGHLLEKLPVSAAKVVCLDSEREQIAACSGENPVRQGGPGDLAYVIYTSGSTGMPKGTPLTHKSLSNYLDWALNEYNPTRGAGVPVQSSIAFDATITSLYLPIISGSRAILLPEKQELDGLAQLLRYSNRLSLIKITPAHLEALNQQLEKTGYAQAAYALIIGGEALTTGQIQPWLTHAPQVRLINEYGPTESVVGCCIYDARWQTDLSGNVPIGRPIANTQIYILDGSHNPAPPGIPGELCIAGAGLAGGYLNRPELSKEKFIEIDILGKPQRLYKSGDFARRLPDGNLECLGRLDHQIKLRGFRIELPEIEAALSRHEAVKDAVVVLYKDDNPRLAAYVTLAEQMDDAAGVLRNWLKSRLPEYMLPAAFTVLDRLPLTPNGKIDREALPAPGAISNQKDAGVIKPQTPVQQQVAQIWREVLKLENVGIRDNFFDLGGHSLLAIQVQSRLQSLLGESLPIVKLFQYPTIQGLAAYITGSVPGESVEQTKPAHDDSRDIAVIGMAGRFPGAQNIETFWNNLREGLESIQFFSDGEMEENGAGPALLNNPGYVKAGAILEDAELFDALFFGYSPKEAEILDPQQRLFLETAWTGIEHAGYDAARLDFPVGVFAGAGMNTYLIRNLLQNPTLLKTLGDYQVALGGDKDFIPVRTAYKLNLKGPALTIQTACSTSLAAVHIACQSLLNGECEMALAGGVSVSFPQGQGYLYQEGMIASPDGHCRAFAASARGTVGGAGAGVVVLKRLGPALAGHDTIHAVIKGSAVNNDGMDRVGFTAPGVDGQASVIAGAMRGLDYESIGYIEAHGTGTILGDPIEITALTRAYRAQTQKTNFCALGSVKTNVGHLDSAAGVTGLIKTVLALKHREIPPTLHFDKPNPQIDFAGSPFFVNTQLRAWQSPSPLRAGVSSFGIGGTNVHVVLEEAPVQTSPQSNRRQLLCISAQTESALERLSSSLADVLAAQPGLNLADTAYTLNLGRKALTHRGFLVSRDLSEAENILRRRDPGGWRQSRTDDKEPPIVFMFPGQGAQYVNMAAGLYKEEPLFRTIVDECARLLEPHLGLDLRELLYPADNTIPHLEPTQYSQPALFVTEYALAKLFIARGIEPEAMIGHSIGEYVAACLAGVFSLPEALQLVAVRGQLMQAQAQGEMLSLSLPEEEIEMLLTDGLSIAAHNAPGHYVVSGPASSAAKLTRELERRHIEYRPLHTSHAFHSPMMEPMLPAFREQLQKLSLNPPQRPYISNLTGTWMTAAQATSVDYWCDHCLNTVRFSDGIQTLLEQNAYILLELGPGRALSTLARQQQPQQAVTAFNVLRPATSAQDDGAFLLDTLGQLWLKNVPLDWKALYAGEQRLRIPLPTYPFEGQRYWIDPAPVPLTPAVPAKKVKRPLDQWFYLPHWKPTAPLSLQPDAGPLNLSKWLIFIDKQGLGSELAQALEKQGGHMITVQTGKTFERHNDRHYTVNPHRHEDYRDLFDSLAEGGQLPEGVLHLWSLDTKDELEQGLIEGFYSLLFLAQTWPKTGQDRYLFVVSNQIHAVTGGEELRPLAAALLGPVQTIGSEYPDLHCRGIDIVWPGPGADTHRLVVDLSGECQTTGTERLAAYRGGQRWVRAFDPIRLPAVNAGMAPLRHKGVYLITGGLGGIGLSLAAYLAERVQAGLVLIGRSPLPDYREWDDWLARHDEDDAVAVKIRRIRELQRSGAEVSVLHADVSNREQMRAAIEQANARFGTIHGVIHAAGVPAGGVVELKTAAQSARILSPKVQGSIILNELLETRQLDFLVFCSSLNAMMETPGQVDYCSANAFLDAYAHELYARGVNAVSINWAGWQDVGMAANIMLPEKLKAAYLQDLQANGILPAEGVEAFARILAHPMPQVLISTVDWQQFSKVQKNEWVEKSDQLTNITESPRQNRPDLATGYVEPHSPTERQIADIWQLLLGIEPIGIYDDFFELGGHSLLMTQLILRLHENLSVKFPMQTLFQFPTIAGLAEQVDKIQTVRRQLQTADNRSADEFEEIEL